jgi:hypothetical protein
MHQLHHQIEQKLQARGTDAAGALSTENKRAGAGSAPASPNKRRKTQKILITARARGAMQKWRSAAMQEGLTISISVRPTYIIIAHTFPLRLMPFPHTEQREGLMSSSRGLLAKRKVEKCRRQKYKEKETRAGSLKHFVIQSSYGSVRDRAFIFR